MGQPKLDAAGLADAVAHHLKYSLAKNPSRATALDRFQALGCVVRDQLTERWIETQVTYHQDNVKRACYFSQEWLLGRLLMTNLAALGLESAAREAFAKAGQDLADLAELEPDPGLGNGGLGRLAACLLESLATLSYPAVGYGLRYEYGLFRQRIQDGQQVEEPDSWLVRGWPFEVQRPEYTYPVGFGGRVEVDPHDPLRFRWVGAKQVLGTAFDIPIAGYGSDTVNTLRLWSARATSEFELEDFSSGDYEKAVERKVLAENLTKVLYPDDRVYAGRELRLRQEYLLVSCSLQDILRRHLSQRDKVDTLADKVAVQMNDTHPALAVAELMRLLVDVYRLPWEKAFEITRGTTSYTNHTLMSEALEQWPVEMLERLLPRHLQIIYEINRRLLEGVAKRWPGDDERLKRMSLIDEGAPRRVRMGHLAVTGSHAVNGVSAIHSKLVTKRLFPEFHEAFPERFTSVTNGVTPRRWLRVSNSGLAKLITDRLGSEKWVRDLTLLRALESAAEEPAFRQAFRDVKLANKKALADHCSRRLDLGFDPTLLLDVQVKRLHEYKRQLLNALHIVHLYRKLREQPGVEIVPRTFLFAAKAAPAYWQAKRIIRLIHMVGEAIDKDPAVKGRLKVVFLPDYRVSLAERIIPAADLSEQISTAGTEASGTGNMKLGLNGALTIGTLDGAQIEMLEEVGPENIFTFGLTAEEVSSYLATGRNRGWELYANDPELKATVDFLFSGHFCSDGILEPCRASILGRNDPWMVLADFPAYVAAQEAVSARWRDREAWTRSAVLNVARLGKFGADRMAQEYATRIWGLRSEGVNLLEKKAVTRMFHKPGSLPS